MPARPLLLIPGLLVALIAGAWQMFGRDERPRQAPANADDAEARARTPHYVTPKQLQASNAMVERVVDDLTATTSDGRSLRWSELSDGAPVVLVFVKRGCPCSIEFAPYFQQVAARYRDAVRFADVIDADVARAARWKHEHDVAYTVLADADQRLIQRFGAANGAYVALLTPEGQIDKFWPGFSREALREMGARIAVLTGRPPQALEVGGLPAALTSGCPFR